MNVVEWLEGFDTTSNVAPVTLTIGKATWQGAVYTEAGRVSYYLIGDRPASHRRARVCYRLPDDERDWFIACYIDDFTNLTESQNTYHPFGNNWVMKCWDCDGSIDEYAEKPYKRMKATLT